MLRHPRMGELFGIDARGLAAFRIGLAVLLLIDLATRARYLSVHYSDDGLVSRKLMMGHMNDWSCSLYWANGSAMFAGVMFLLAAVFALLLLVGYRTRLATVVCWVLLVSLQYRNLLVCSAGDHVLRLLLFWGIFLPLGLRGSLDSRLRGDRDRDEVPGVVLSLGTLGLLVQLVSIYVFSSLLKTSPVWYRDGTALYYSLSLDRLTTPLGRWLLEFPDLCRGLSIGTVWLEMLGPALAFMPIETRYFRTLTVLLFVGFHVGMIFTMNLILFPYVCIVAWIVFLPPWFWDKVFATGVGDILIGRWRGLIDGCAGRIRRREETGARHTWRPALYRQCLGANLLAGFFILYVFGWNIHSVTEESEKPPIPRAADMLGLNQTARDSVRGIGTLLGISQGWKMFAPRPPRENGWWVAAATLDDGSEVDLYRGGSAISWEKPASVADEFRSHRWRKYMMSLWSKGRRYHAPHYARWLREEWNTAHDDKRQVASLELYFMLQYTRPPGEPPLEAKMLVYRWSKSGADRLVSYSTNRREYQRLLKQAAN